MHWKVENAPIKFLICSSVHAKFYFDMRKEMWVERRIPRTLTLTVVTSRHIHRHPDNATSVATDVAWSYGLSVCLSAGYNCVLYKNGWTDRDAIWAEYSGVPKEPCVSRGSGSPNGWDNFGGHLPALANYWGVWRESHFSLGGGSDAAFSWCFSVSFLNFFCLLTHVSLLCLCVKGGQHWWANAFSGSLPLYCCYC